MPRRTDARSDSATGADGSRLSPERFAAEYQSAWRRLWCIAASTLGDRASVDDVLQEAAIIGLRKIDDFEPGTSFSAWMGRIVRNVALNEGRRHARAKVKPIEPGQLSQTTESPNHGTSQEGFDDRVVDSVNRLSEIARTCLLLRTIHDMSYAEIARVTGLPEGTAMSHVHRARKSMRESLAEHFGGVRGALDTEDDR